MNARGAVFRGVGRPFDFVEWPLPSPRETEILVEVIACTLCGSDLHSIHGRRSVPVPTILGHEILGRVVAFGPEAASIDAAGLPLGLGDRVTWAIVASCGDCYYCHRDLPQKCERGFKYGHEPLRPGRELAGGLADHCLLAPGTAIYRVPDEIPDEVACPSSCATATIAAALEAAGPIAGRTVLVLGAGMLGVTASAWSRESGARETIVCDRDEARLAVAVGFGATRTCTPTQFASTIAEATGRRGIDVVLELSGDPRAIEGALPLLATGGTLVLVGSVFPTDPVPILPEKLVRGCLTLRGVHNYAPRHLHAALNFLAANHRKYPLASLVSAWQPLDALDALVASPAGALRYGIRP